LKQIDAGILSVGYAEAGPTEAAADTPTKVKKRVRTPKATARYLKAPPDTMSERIAELL
jgi:hypothetical protein